MNDVFAVQQNGGIISYLYPTSSGTLTSWDNSGNPLTYTYLVCNATVDISQSWALLDITTGENLGAVASVLDGWQPWQPGPTAGLLSLNINQAHRDHVVELRQADGTVQGLVPALGYDNHDTVLSAWNTYTAGSIGPLIYQIDYFPARFKYDPAQAFTIVDIDTGEDKPFPAGTATVDLSQWFLPPAPLITKFPSPAGPMNCSCASPREKASP